MAVMAMTRRSFFKALLGAAALPVVAKLLPEKPKQSMPKVFLDEIYACNSSVLTEQMLEDQYAIMKGYQKDLRSGLIQRRNAEAVELFNNGFAYGQVPDGTTLFSTVRL